MKLSRRDLLKTLGVGAMVSGLGFRFPALRGLARKTDPLLEYYVSLFQKGHVYVASGVVRGDGKHCPMIKIGDTTVWVGVADQIGFLTPQPFNVAFAGNGGRLILTEGTWDRFSVSELEGIQA